MEERKMRPRPRRSRRKVCKFCVDKATSIDYKDVRTLEKFVTAPPHVRRVRKAPA